VEDVNSDSELDEEEGKKKGNVVGEIPSDVVR
jgi:hypothetical protein